MKHVEKKKIGEKRIKRKKPLQTKNMRTIFANFCNSFFKKQNRKKKIREKISSINLYMYVCTYKETEIINNNRVHAVYPLSRGWLRE